MSISNRLMTAEIESLYSAASSAIWHSHRLAKSRSHGCPREEDFVATIVTEGVRILAERWSEILSPKGVSLRVSGVFCHGHPQVEFGLQKSRVELADLLLVHQHSTTYQTRSRTTVRAMLVQAKMSSDGRHTLRSDDPQLLLYSKWPQFSFVTGGLGKDPRNLDEHGKGSRYALVLDKHVFPEEIRWADQCPWASCRPSQELAADRSFSRLLGDMLLGKDGRTAKIHSPSHEDHWSRTIRDLLHITGKRTFNRKNIDVKNIPRLSDAYTLFYSNAAQLNQNLIPKTAITHCFFSFAKDSEIETPHDHIAETNTFQDIDQGLSTLIIETYVTDKVKNYF